jgi:hypothetical protein
MVKPITLSSSYINEVYLQAVGSPPTSLKVVILGGVLDENGDLVKKETLTKTIGEFEIGTQVDINGMMRELSEEFNLEFANEPANTWVDV